MVELQAENARLRKELARVEMEREIVKKLRRILRGSLCKVREAFMQQLETRNHYPMAVMCKALEVSRSGCHV